jgi:dimethylamine/trimethylamine dehydrogenase
MRPCAASTEEVEIHPTSDVAPFIEGRLWDDLDIPALELITRAVHGFRRELPH